MQAEVSSYQPGRAFAWPVLFPLKYTPKFDIKGIEGEDGIPIAADRVAFNVKSPLKTRKKVGSWSGELDKLSVSQEKDEKKINEYEDLKTIAAANTEDKEAAQYLVDMVYDDIKFVNDGIDAKVEIDALRIGSLAKKTYPASIEGDTATEDVIDFNVPEGNFKFSKWSGVNADPIADVKTWQKYISGKGLKKPMFAFIDEDMLDVVLQKDKTLKRVSTIVLNATGLQASDILTIENLNRYMKQKGFPQFVSLDSTVLIQDKKGNETTVRPWNKNVVVLSPVPRLGYTYFKPVPIIKNTDAMQVRGAFSKTTVYSELNPMLEVTMCEAYVQPALSNRASLIFANVDNAAAWADGVSA
ncbi:MAG: hypothetical protein A2X18_07695 [Bacteroidetes bacterium GWF2_40_14]|nr:MAG: hypothetical protein A2X18_07695 [Bacteroidetes bacterium GWF2_40_14]